MYTNFLVTPDGPVTTVQLNRPEKRNPINEEMVGELHQVLDGIRDDAGCRIVIVTGSGPAFCAGADLSRLKGVADTEERLKVFTATRGRRTTKLRDALDKLEALEQVTIAAINGFAIGGGWHLAMACDFRYAAPEAQFWLPELDLGNPINAQAYARLARAVGVMRAKEFVMTCGHYNAQDLFNFGILTRVVPKGQLLSEARAFADKLLAKRPEGLALAKTLGNALELSMRPRVKILSPKEFLSG
ncbi:MAG: enoyl-CoA hydratase/isomerase family protein [Chloroflexi bacterium]|nr:enoyl-CoA hydratase/isomerase family protein [Chloroflexota bacterium]